VREDFLDEKKALDEVEPYIFGIPQMVERDSFDRAEASASSVHEECMAVRREWSRWYFGDKPDMAEVLRWKGLNNKEKFEEGILRLRRGAQYEPTKEQLESGLFATVIEKMVLEENFCLDFWGVWSEMYNRAKACYHPAIISSYSIADEQQINETSENLTRYDEILHEAITLDWPDIYQRYAETCYDSVFTDIVSSCSTTTNMKMWFANLLEQETTLSAALDCEANEPSMREAIYRCMKILIRHNFQLKNFDAATLDNFDEGLQSLLTTATKNCTFLNLC
jgi:hypothetical protein